MPFASNMSHRDKDQINKYEHQDDACAKRVYVVGGDFKLDIDPSQITAAVKEGLKTIEIKSQPVSESKQIQVIEVEKTIPIKEVQIVEIEKPVVVVEHKVQIVEVEKPIVTESVVTIEKPIYIPGETKVVTVEIPTVQIIEKIVEKIPAYIYAILTLEAAIIAFLVLK